mgnify:CR=1 FL=1
MTRPGDGRTHLAPRAKRVIFLFQSGGPSQLELLDYKPDLGQHVVTSKLMTPQDFQDRLWSYQGAAFGLEPILLQSAWFRPHNKSEELEGLYLVGAGTHPGAGLPGVISSSKVVADLLPDAKFYARKA